MFKPGDNVWIFLQGMYYGNGVVLSHIGMSVKGNQYEVEYVGAMPGRGFFYEHELARPDALKDLFNEPPKAKEFKKCTCGSAAVNHPGHSSWCDVA